MTVVKKEIVIRTTAWQVTLKLSKDHDSAFCGMAAVASSVVEYGNVATPIAVPNVHLRYDDVDMEIGEITFQWH